jgi:16S rRNA (cytidine1402-2'-O)-methyltransferase
VTGGFAPGTLVLVATPIGNLGDLPPRAVDAIRDAELVCCEDTRRTGKLLKHAGVIAKRLAVVNAHTELERVQQVLDVLADGGTVVVVTDAGTPGISDPGEALARAALDAGYDVSAVPGPAALIVALITSGLATSRFVFEGFLPRSGRDRAERIAEVAAERRTTVLYEAPHRIARTLVDLLEACGPDRQVSVGRELTKLHETTWRGRLGDASERPGADDPMGEYVVVVAGAPAADAPDALSIDAAAQQALDSGLSPRDAAAAIAAALGVGKRVAYDAVLAARAASRVVTPEPPGA